MCTYGEKKEKEIAFIQIFLWARCHTMGELTLLHASLQEAGIGIPV